MGRARRWVAPNTVVDLPAAIEEVDGADAAVGTEAAAAVLEVLVVEGIGPLALVTVVHTLVHRVAAAARARRVPANGEARPAGDLVEIGRASCRERVFGRV